MPRLVRVGSVSDTEQPRNRLRRVGSVQNQGPAFNIPDELTSLGDVTGGFARQLEEAQPTEQQALPNSVLSDAELQQLAIDARAEQLRSQSVRGAFAGEAVEGAPGAAVSLIGAVTGAKILGSFGSLFGRYGEGIGTAAGALAGGLGTPILAEAAAFSPLRNALTSPEEEQAVMQSRALTAQDYPIASFLGQMAPQALAARPSVAAGKQALGLARRIISGNADDVARYVAQNPEAAAHLNNMVVGAGAGGGIQAVQEAYGIASTDEDASILDSIARVGLATVAGGAMNTPTALGTAMGMRPAGAPTTSARSAVVQAGLRSAVGADTILPTRIAQPEVAGQPASNLARDVTNVGRVLLGGEPMRPPTPPVPRARNLNQTGGANPAEAQSRINEMTMPKPQEAQAEVPPVAQPDVAVQPESARVAQAVEAQQRVQAEQQAQAAEQVRFIEEARAARDALLDELNIPRDQNPYDTLPTQQQIDALVNQRSLAQAEAQQRPLDNLSRVRSPAGLRLRTQAPRIDPQEVNPPLPEPFPAPRERVPNDARVAQRDAEVARQAVENQETILSLGQEVDDIAARYASVVGQDAPEVVQFNRIRDNMAQRGIVTEQDVRAARTVAEQLRLRASNVPVEVGGVAQGSLLRRIGELPTRLQRDLPLRNLLEPQPRPEIDDINFQQRALEAEQTGGPPRPTPDQIRLMEMQDLREGRPLVRSVAREGRVVAPEPTPIQEPAAVREPTPPALREIGMPAQVVRPVARQPVTAPEAAPVTPQVTQQVTPQAAEASPAPRATQADSARLAQLQSKPRLTTAERVEYMRLRSNQLRPAQAEQSPVPETPNTPTQNTDSLAPPPRPVTPERVADARAVIEEKPVTPRTRRRGGVSRGSSGMSGREGFIAARDIMDALQAAYAKAKGDVISYTDEVRRRLGPQARQVGAQGKRIFDALTSSATRQGTAEYNAAIHMSKLADALSAAENPIPYGITREEANARLKELLGVGQDVLTPEALAAVRGRLNVPSRRRGQYKSIEAAIRAESRNPIEMLKTRFLDSTNLLRNIMGIEGMHVDSDNNLSFAASRLFGSRRQQLIRSAENELRSTLKTDLLPLAQRLGADIETVAADVSSYAIAQHAPAYNAAAERRLQQRLAQAAKQANTTPDVVLDTLMQGGEIEGVDEALVNLIQRGLSNRGRASGMTDAEARNLSESVRARYGENFNLIRESTGFIRNISRRALDILEESGLISTETKNTLISTYPDYVPLQRVFAEDPDALPAFDPRLFMSDSGKRSAERSRSSSGLRPAEGSQRDYSDVIGNVMAGFRDAVERSAMNDYNRTIALFFRQNIEANPEMFKYLDAEGNERSWIEFSRTPVAGEQVIEWRERAPVLDDNGVQRVDDNGNPMFRSERHYMSTPSPELYDMLTMQHRMGATWLGGMILGKGARWLSAVYTRLNLAFAPVNVIRDAQEAYFNLLEQTGSVQIARGMHRELMGAIREINTFEKSEGAGILRPDLPPAEAEQLARSNAVVRQFYELGGAIGGYGRQSRDEILRSTQDFMAQVDPNGRLDRITRNALLNVRDAVERWNTVLENGTRFAAFKSALKSGLTPEEAAQIARQSTIDFNRQGTWSRGLGRWFLFFNPGVQGTANLARAARDPRTLLAAATAYGTAAFMEDAYNQWVEDSYNENRLPGQPVLDYRRMMAQSDRTFGFNFLDPTNPLTPDGRLNYSRLPVSYSYRPMMELARVATELSMGREVDPGDQVGRLAQSAMAAISPVGDPTRPELMIAPAAARPILEVGYNRTGLDRVISPDRRNEFEDSAQLYFRSMADNTSGRAFISAAQRFAEFANAIGSDSMRTSNFATPGALEHLTQSYLGGLALLPRQVIDTAANTAKWLGDPEFPATENTFPRLRDIPVVSSFIRQRDIATMRAVPENLPEGLPEAAREDANLARERSRNIQRVASEYLETVNRWQRSGGEGESPDEFEARMIHEGRIATREDVTALRRRIDTVLTNVLSETGRVLDMMSEEGASFWLADYLARAAEEGRYDAALEEVASWHERGAVTDRMLEIAGQELEARMSQENVVDGQ